MRTDSLSSRLTPNFQKEPVTSQLAYLQSNGQRDITWQFARKLRTCLLAGKRQRGAARSASSFFEPPRQPTGMRVHSSHVNSLHRATRFVVPRSLLRPGRSRGQPGAPTRATFFAHGLHRPRRSDRRLPRIHGTPPAAARQSVSLEVEPPSRSRTVDRAEPDVDFDVARKAPSVQRM